MEDLKAALRSAPDLYSVGATFYRRLTGAFPGEPYVPLRGGAPARILRVIEGCLQGGASVAELLAMLGPTQLEGHRGWVRSLDFNADGSLLASGSEDRTVRIWDTQTGQEKARIEHGGWVSAVLFQESLLVSASHDRRLTVWNGDILRVVCPDVPLCLAFNYDSSRLAIGYQKGRIEVRSFPGLEIQFELLAPAAVQACAFCPPYLVTACDERLWLWDGGELVDKLPGHKGTILSLHTMADGRLASGSSDMTVRLWDLARGESQQVGSHRGKVHGLSGSLFSGSGDKTIRAWPSGETVGTHAGEVSALAYHSVCGLASGGQDNLIRLWDVIPSPAPWPPPGESA